MQASKAPHHFQTLMRVILLASLTVAATILGWGRAAPGAVYSANQAPLTGPVVGYPARRSLFLP